MAQVIDFSAAKKAKQAKAGVLSFPTFKVPSTKRVRLAERAQAVRMAAKERI